MLRYGSPLAIIDAGPVQILAAGADLDLRHLADAARDRSADGRARLFALLAALMVSRWSGLKPGERQQLGELLAVLWPRGLLADRQRLADDLVERPDVPALLQGLLTSLQKPAPRTTAADGAMVLKSAKAKPVTIVMRRPPPRPHSEPPHPEPAPASAMDEMPSTARLAEPSKPSMTGDDLFFDSAPSIAKSPPATVPLLDEPRDNPHRLTGELLTATLAQGDLNRFEAMLAQLTQLRTPLLRRLLQDSGDEGFAILAHAAGIDTATFQQQWRAWREQVAKLRPYTGLPNRHEGEAIGVFFAALTDPQVDRLIQRWRHDGERLFRNNET